MFIRRKQFWWSSWPIVSTDVVGIKPSPIIYICIHMRICVYMYIYVQYMYFVISSEFRLMDRYYRLNVNWWLDGHQFNKDFMINYRYYRSKRKILYRWIDPVDGQHDRYYRSMVSLSIYRTIADYVQLCWWAKILLKGSPPAVS